MKHVVTLTPELRNDFLKYRTMYGPVKASEMVGISRSTGYRIWREFTETVAQIKEEEPPPKDFEELDKVAKRGVEQFRFFCTEYLNLYTAPWWDEVVAALGKFNSTDREDATSFRRVMITTHPGAGKTTLLLAYLTWRITRARALGDTGFSATYGMRTERQAQRGMRFVQTQFTTNKKLIQAYGKFKGATGDEGELTWTRSQIVVLGMSSQKEATFAVLGTGQSVSGLRPFLAIWDDVVDEHNCSPTQTEELLQFWDGVAEHRVEPGGVLAICGVYWSPKDLLHILAKRMFVEENGTETKVWTQYKFRAHYDDRCPGEGKHTQYNPATGEGCLLNPQRWSFRQIDLYRQQNPRLFAMQYQQEDVDGTDTLVKYEWLAGGAGKDGIRYPGCYDYTRSLWQLPTNYSFLAATLDPSPTKFAASFAFAVDDVGGRDYILDLERRRMRPDEYVVHIENWTERLRELNSEFSFWIIERTGAAYLVDTEAFQRLQRRLKLNIIFHETRRNKQDPRYGVWGAIPQAFEHGRVSIPFARVADRLRMDIFREELCSYPYGTTDDTVMAFWFLTLHRATISSVKRGRARRRDVPSWVKELDYGLLARS